MKLFPFLIGVWVVALASVAVIIRLENRRKRSLVSPYNPPEQAFKPVVDITV